MANLNQAKEWGTEDGIEDVETVAAEQGIDVVKATLAPGHVEWDEGAINAGAHTFRGISDPDEKEAYYEAYRVAARAHAEKLTSKD